MAILGDDEVREALAGRRGWRRTGDVLVRERSLRDFAEALVFLERIGAAVDDWGRHPDVAIIGGNRVRVTVTNPNGAGFTDAELRLVAKVDEVADAPLPVPDASREAVVAVAAVVAEDPAAPVQALVPARAEEEPQPADPASPRGRRKALAAVLVGGVATAAAGVVAVTRRR
jgi:pterin-4a-carbinolamine dehydratase